jgi:predicted nucleic acid-binding protein
VSYLIDTNVISELYRGEKCDPRVARWFDSIGDADLFISVLVLGEIRKGAEKIRHRDPDRAKTIEIWLSGLEDIFDDRVLPVDSQVADVWGRMSARRSVPVVDCLQAATAKVLGLTMVTRNTSDFDGLDVAVLNPFAP